MKQTAVEFLHEALSIHLSFGQQMQFEGLFLQAKEMEKQQMSKIYEGILQNVGTSIKQSDLPTFEQYYNETFGSKGSDDHTEQILEMVEKSEKPINLTSSKTEISDEEIDKQSKYWNETTNPEMWTYKLAWKAGAKWYREQLKNNNQNP